MYTIAGPYTPILKMIPIPMNQVDCRGYSVTFLGSALIHSLVSSWRVQVISLQIKSPSLGQTSSPSIRSSSASESLESSSDIASSHASSGHSADSASVSILSSSHSRHSSGSAPCSDSNYTCSCSQRRSHSTSGSSDAATSLRSLASSI